MAGYLFSLDSIDALAACLNNGAYSTILSSPGNNFWKIHHEGTFADYSSMSAGDNVYFFIDRKIYGIGALVNINGNCKYLNYPSANIPTNQTYNDIRELCLLDNGVGSINNRFICIFEPSPFFFRNGIDMDEVLSSSPEKFKILRTFWKLSFIKFPDEENQAFKNILLRRNIEAINDNNNQNTYHSNFVAFHEEIRIKTLNDDRYVLGLAPFLNTINNEDGSLKHEMAIEAAIIHQLTNTDVQSIEIFGQWDYLSHQVIASPFKPIDYMDKMDVFGYRYITNQKPTIFNYMVIEIKKGVICSQDILQLMKYVDWIKNEYAYGDYSMINAFMVGSGCNEEALQGLVENVERKFIQGVRPAVPLEWRNVKIVKYTFNNVFGKLDFQQLADANELVE